MEEYLVYILSPLFAAFGFITRFIWDFYINRRKRELQEKIKHVEYRLKEFYYPIYFNLKREQIIWDKILKLHQTTIEKENITININENRTIPSPIQEQKCIELSIPENIQPENIQPENIQPENIQPENIQPENIQPENIQPENDQIDMGPDTHPHVELIKALDEENLKIHKAVQDIVHNKISIALPPKHLVELLMQYDEHVTVYQILRAMGIYDRFPTEYDAPYPHNIINEVDKRIKELDVEYIKYNKKLG